MSRSTPRRTSRSPNGFVRSATWMAGVEVMRPPCRVGLASRPTPSRPGGAWQHEWRA
jgi:hypothetical protein